ncbi:G-type lectin S-receptor-like serine/threonine-protein kinase [Senna tora]|uniref:non-specific serine/threonine protein kinase n=1 Tax=Senna tora TaxID=362788 RepID=A0A834TIG3_9FABA|nr:G-type lectin S-receptor-like serine/threonine-protein kinase [Senna tora]
MLVLSLQVFSFALVSIAQSQSFTDGMTLLSKGGTFELGFFSPGTSNKRYLGIWYKNIPIPTVVWVANRLNPINDSSGILTLNTTGNLVLSQNDTVVWSSTITTSVEKKPEYSPEALLLDSGNLVVRDKKNDNPEAYLWQSFDYPSDTFLPGMKFGWDLGSGLNRRLTAWKSPDDPSPGDLSWEMVLNNYPDAYMMKETHKFYRGGPWNGVRPSGSPQLQQNPLFEFEFVDNKDEVYFMYHLKNMSVISRQVLNQTINARQRFVWLESEQIWSLYASVPMDYCDNYGLCGAYGSCMISGSPVCQCLEGFRPKSPEAWNSMDWSRGCVRKKPLRCEEKHRDGFVKLSGLKVPDTEHTWIDERMNLKQCREKCLSNCSCMAYANSDIKGKGSGCALWFGDLIDIRQFAEGGQDLFVRMAASELEADGNRKKVVVLVASVVTISVAVVTGALTLGWCYMRKVGKNVKEELECSNKGDQNKENQVDDLDLPFFDLLSIAAATSNFSIKNKIGEGGFGPVGYMAPEYASDGLFSVKSDVFSFGVLLLEIISGKRSRGYYSPNHSHNLIGHAWKLWKEERPIELIDTSLQDSCFLSQILHCIHVGLLCVQQHPEDRPVMSCALLMLVSDIELPEAKQPGYFGNASMEVDSSSSKQELSTTNDITITLLEPR